MDTLRLIKRKPASPARWRGPVVAFLALGMTGAAFAVVPEFTMDDGAVHIKGVGPGNPIIYDNDWWFNVFDNNYLWAQASLGKVNLRGNIVSRDMWNWDQGYLYPMQRCLDDAAKALDLARRSGLRHLPDMTRGCGPGSAPASKR